MFLSKCHVWGPKGLGSRLGREGRELQDVGWLESFGTPPLPPPPQFGIGFKRRGRFRQDFPESVFIIGGYV